MKYIDEYRRMDAVNAVIQRIQDKISRKWVIMEICGGQTHSIMKYGIDRLLPELITLVHGPGCPVCVTPASLIDSAVRIAFTPNTELCSFGDMLRVPGNEYDLLTAKANGARVNVVYSPLDAVRLAAANRKSDYVFFAVGFETTAPITALAIQQANHLDLRNFSLLVAHFLVPPAVSAIVSSANNTIQGLIAPGHVCAVTGWVEYERLAQKFSIPSVVTGFEPLDIVQGVALCLDMLEGGIYEVHNQYKRVVKREGNPSAMESINTVFEVTDREWRGIGTIPGSGLRLKKSWNQFDATIKFNIEVKEQADKSTGCIAGLILQGIKTPSDCPAFRSICTPEKPLGAPMVSSEGACSAYYRYRPVGGE